MDARELVDSLAGGDRSAVEQLMVRYLPDLRGFLGARRYGVLRAQEEVDDLASSVCREVLERLDRGAFEYRGEPQFRAWLYEAALLKLNEKRRFWAAEKRDPRKLAAMLSASRVLAEELVKSQHSPSEAVQQAAEVDQLSLALEQLADRDRQLILWARFDGLEHQEIAKRLEITEAHSRVLLSRALARLAILLD